MANDQHTQDQDPTKPAATPNDRQVSKEPHAEVDGLKGKKPEDLTPEELRLMADTMPGDGPGD
ncbi:MAG TPA: hypothetical protein VF861_01695 [Telluria sp.]